MERGDKGKKHRKVGFVSQSVLNNPGCLSLFIVSDGWSYRISGLNAVHNVMLL